MKKKYHKIFRHTKNNECNYERKASEENKRKGRDKTREKIGNTLTK